MAKDSSFDVVSEIDPQEVRNAVDQASREITTRFDFKGTGSSVELTDDGGSLSITVKANTEQKVKDVVKVLEEKFVKRKLSLKSLQHGTIEPAAGGTARQTLTINQGISTEKAREIVKHIKDQKMKAQVAIQGDQVRVSAKSRDTLQEVIQSLKEHDFGIPLQYVNYR
ncbi:MAG TPA: YajQ family cyclic di-GMP-binding protein [Actinomycetota bacterium]|nr:YajQ family cyclic di-GMP-binding protein [Actinomycetota bacterium]